MSKSWMFWWDYRIVKYADGSGYGLHEIHYRDGKPMSMTGEAVPIFCNDDEGPEGIIKSLQRALDCVTKRGVLLEADICG